MRFIGMLADFWASVSSVMMALAPELGRIALMVAIAISVQLAIPYHRRKKLTKRVQLKVLPSLGAQVRIAIKNNCHWPIKDAIVYFQLDVKADDLSSCRLAELIHEIPFVQRDAFVPITGNLLVWAIRWPTINPMVASIYAGEEKGLALCEIRRDVNWIVFPSEEGWGFSKGIGDLPKELQNVLHEDKHRSVTAIVKLKEITGKLILVSADTEQREWRFRVDPSAELGRELTLLD